MKQVWTLLVLVFLAASGRAETPLNPEVPIAFLGLVFLDTSTEGAYFGVRADETARTKLVEDYVTAEFAKRGFTLIDIAPAQAKLDTISNIADCYGCEQRIAQNLNAPRVMVGEIQKVSNLILSMNLVLRDAQTGEMLRGLSVDYRSNTDASWLRAMRYILKYHYFGE